MLFTAADDDSTGVVPVALTANVEPLALTRYTAEPPCGSTGDPAPGG